MIRFTWSEAKNEKLKAERGLGFEDIVAAVEAGGLLDDVTNPSSNFPDQRALIVAVKGYAIVVPYVAEGDEMFLKTAFPSRQATRTYLRR